MSFTVKWISGVTVETVDFRRVANLWMIRIMKTHLINIVTITMIFTVIANSLMIKKLLMSRSFICFNALSVRTGSIMCILSLFWNPVMLMKSIFLFAKHAFRLMVKIIRERFLIIKSFFILKSKNFFQRMNVKIRKLFMSHH